MQQRNKCSVCGSHSNVFFTVISKNGNYSIQPICINCQRKETETAELILWEHELKDIENIVADQLIQNKFTNIKFKSSAKKLLLQLMQKYSVRCVFNVCILLNSDFNPHLISALCKKKFIS